MKCLICHEYALSPICSTCRELHLKPTIYKRVIKNNIMVISFYRYDEIKALLHTKHTHIGYHIYRILAESSFKKFAKEFNMGEDFVAIGIDDIAIDGYSHTAILTKSLTCRAIKPIFSKLRATNRLSYSKKSREFRMKNPRNFVLKPFKEKKVILVDDIITTGSTLSQATEILHKHDKEVFLCLTLADVDRKNDT